MHSPLLLLIHCVTLLASSAANGAPAPNKNLPKPKLPIRVVDLAWVPNWILDKASRLTQEMLRRAGVDTEWLPACRVTETRDASHYAPECAAAMRGVADEVVIRLVDQRMVAPEVSDWALGFTNLTSGNVYVYYSRIEKSHLADIQRRPALLALVMTHETGHYLGLRHTEDGIMRPDVRPMDVEDTNLRRIQFAGEEARALRERAGELESRWLAAALPVAEPAH